MSIEEKFVENSVFIPVTKSTITLPEATLSERGEIPSVTDCFHLWEQFSMPEHIKNHSCQVARIASELAFMRYQDEQSPHFRAIQTCALLHDLGKIYCIKNGGDHAAVGAAWVQAITKNPYLSQGVMHHVYWPGTIDLDRHFLPLAIIYADKRVRHDTLVSLQERTDDLLVRYGTTSEHRKNIKIAMQQGVDIEKALNKRFGVQLNEHTFNSRWLVKRA